MKQLVIRIAILAFIWIAVEICQHFSAPQYALVNRNFALAAVNGGDAEMTASQTAQSIYSTHTIYGIATAIKTLALLLLALPYIRLAKVRLAKYFAPIGGVCALLMCGCQPYNAPQYEEIASNETAFVIPLEGATKEQQKFASESILNDQKVATKRILITKRWNQTGRMYFDGAWIPMMRVIKVDRSPVTRAWQADEDARGIAVRVPMGKNQKNPQHGDAIWIESMDSVGFSMGFNVTAYIAEEDTAKFLYMYAGNTLSIVIDHEVRARVQQVAAEVAAEYPLDKLREKKNEIAERVRADALPFFQKRGITITTIGMFGGMTYENADIQQSIDKTFVMQQEKVNTLSKLEAQASENTRIVQQAKAKADAEVQEAEGKSKALAIEAEGKAKAIKLESEALAAAQQNPAYIRVKEMEILKSQVEKWSGKYPDYYIGSQNVSSLLALPSTGLSPINK